MVLGPVQVLFECAPSDAERKTDLFRCRLPRKFVVAGSVRREESPRLLLGEFGQEQRGRVGDPISARRDGAPLRNEAGTGKLIEKGLRVGPVLQDQRHPRFAVLPTNRRNEVRALIRERRDDFFLATRAVEQQGDLVPGPRRLEDFAAGTVDLGGPIEAIHVSKAAEEQASAHRIRIAGEARTSVRGFLPRPFGKSLEAHLCRHTTSPSAAGATVPCRPIAFASVPRARMPPDMAAEGITLGPAIAGDSPARTWGVA